MKRGKQKTIVGRMRVPTRKLDKPDSYTVPIPVSYPEILWLEAAFLKKEAVKAWDDAEHPYALSLGKKVQGILPKVTKQNKHEPVIDCIEMNHRECALIMDLLSRFLPQSLQELQITAQFLRKLRQILFVLEPLFGD